MLMTAYYFPIYYSNPYLAEALQALPGYFLEDVRRAGLKDRTRLYEKLSIHDSSFFVVTTYELAVSARVLTAQEAAHLTEENHLEKMTKHFDLLHPPSNEATAYKVAHAILSTTPYAMLSMLRWAIARIPDYPEERLVEAVFRRELPADVLRMRRHSDEIRATSITACDVPLAKVIRP
jgi:hypothetical protein